MGNIFTSIIITLALLLIGILAMSFKALFIKGKNFPNTHIGASKHMKDRGINCANSQDREAQNSRKI